MTFKDQSEFIAWIKEQPEENWSYSFSEHSSYPLSLSIERRPNRVLVKEL